MISLWFSFQFQSTLAKCFTFVVSTSRLSYHAHVGRANDPRGLLHVRIRFPRECTRAIPSKIMQHLFLQTRLPPEFSSRTEFVFFSLVITSEKIISHHISALSRPSLLLCDNSRKIFTSCLIKAYEIRASSKRNGATFAESTEWKYLLLICKSPDETSRHVSLEPRKTLRSASESN